MSLKIELQQIKQNHKVLTQNLKAVAYKESAEFLREKSRIVAHVLTKNHRKVLTQFIEYKEMTKKKMS